MSRLLNRTGMTLKEIAEDMNVAIPPEFICPLTNEVMTSPAMTRTGVNFERSAIIEWFMKGKITCPVTGQPLDPNGVAKNAALANKIAFWIFSNSLPEPSNETHDDVLGIIAPKDKASQKLLLQNFAMKMGNRNSKSKGPAMAA